MQRSPISIESLETLDAIDRRGSFAKAAEELNKATSAVSYAVQKLEQQLDIALFQPQGRRSVLTPAGQLILAEGREILSSTARLVDKAKEVATGWEPRICIAVESLQSYPPVFAVLHEFLEQHPSVEVDVCESVLNGGWEALEQRRVDLLVGSPGPVPAQKGFRAVQLAQTDLTLVIASTHPLAGAASNRETVDATLDELRRIITHDTSLTGIARSAGLSNNGKRFHVQTIEHKVEAIVAGIGIGHLPRQRIQAHLDSGVLIALESEEGAAADSYLAWRVSHKGKGLLTLTKQLTAELG